MTTKQLKPLYNTLAVPLLAAADNTTTPIPGMIGVFPRQNADGYVDWWQIDETGTERPLYNIPQIDSLPDPNQRAQVLYAQSSGAVAGDDGKARWSEGINAGEDYPQIFLINSETLQPFWDTAHGWVRGILGDYWSRVNGSYSPIFNDPAASKFNAFNAPDYTASNTPKYLLGLQRLGTEGNTLNGDEYSTPTKYPIYRNEMASIFINYKRSVAVPDGSNEETSENYQELIVPGQRLTLKQFNVLTIQGNYTVTRPGETSQRKINIGGASQEYFEIFEPGNYRVDFGATVQYKPVPPAGYSTAHRDGSTTGIPAGTGTKPSFSCALSILVQFADGTTQEFRGVQRQIELQGNDIAYYIGKEETFSASATIKATAYSGNTTKIYARWHWFSFNNMDSWQMRVTADRAGQARCSIQEIPSATFIV